MYTNNRNLPLPVAVWAARETYERKPGYLSGSQLERSNRQIVLGLRVPEQAIDLSSLIASRLGHAINDAIDVAWKRPHLSERIKLSGFNPLFEYEVNPVLPDPKKVHVYIQRHFEEPLGNWMLSGTPDFILAGHLTDYKSTTVFGYQRKEMLDFMWQLTTYRYLGRDVIVDDTATIQFILKDWSERRASKDPEYPQTPAPALLVRVGTPEECKARLLERIALLDSLMSLDQSELPLCSDEELWLDPSKFAYYKNPLADPATRASRVFDTLAEAQTYQGAQKGAGKIVVRKGYPKACDYCQAVNICSQRASWTT